MDNCAVCGEEAVYPTWGADLCSYHRDMFMKWVSRWYISTGHKGHIKITPEKIINMLKNMDYISRSKRAKI